MHRSTRWGLCLGLLLVACGDDVVAGTETEGATGTSAETTEPPTPTTTMTAPTTEEPNTGTNSTTAPSTSEPTTTNPTTTEPTTTEPITSSTSSTTETTTVSTSDTDTDGDTDTDTETDTDTDGELMGRSVSQTVNSGTVASSPNFKMVFTLGQPTQNQGVYTSPSFKLQGGLIGANGNPP
jgi:hypothetical protein